MPILTYVVNISLAKLVFYPKFAFWLNF